MNVNLTMSTCVCWPDDALATVPKAPTKFYVPHVSVSFGPGGQLVCVSPNSPADGQTALVEVHSMEVIKVLGLGGASTLLKPLLSSGLHFAGGWVSPGGGLEPQLWQEWAGFS